MSSSAVRTPKFTDHDGNRKHERLDGTSYGKPEPVIVDFLKAAAGTKAPREVKVLDVGCGRGSRVAWLMEAGWDAWGADIVGAYLDAGQPYFAERGWDTDRLRLFSGELPFDAEEFDVVLSDQVIEHVADLDGYVRSIARVSKSGSVGMHVFPATRRPVEPHLRQPLVHWLPKGSVRRAAIRAAVGMHLGVNHFAELGPAGQAAVFAEFSESETYYRLRRTVRRAFESYGMKTDLRHASLAKTRQKLGGRLPESLLPIASVAYSLFLQTYLTTVKAGA